MSKLNWDNYTDIEEDFELQSYFLENIKMDDLLVFFGRTVRNLSIFF